MLEVSERIEIQITYLYCNIQQLSQCIEKDIL
jgi:hypothetical protein